MVSRVRNYKVFLGETFYQSPFTSYYSLVTSYQLSYQSLVASYYSPITSYQLVTNYQSLVTIYQPLVISYQSIVVVTSQKSVLTIYWLILDTRSHSKAHLLEFFLIKRQSGSLHSIKKGTTTQVFSCEFCKISENIFSIEQLHLTKNLK